MIRALFVFALVSGGLLRCDAFAGRPAAARLASRPASLAAAGRPRASSSALYAKKKKKGGGGGQAQQSKQKVAEQQKDASLSKFMFTIMKLSKEKNGNKILDNINLGFNVGAKIGIVGANGSGKSTLMNIMAGIDKEYDGEARPNPSKKIGYLPQEPELHGKTVKECIEPAVEASRALLQEYEDLSIKMSEDLEPDEFERVCEDMAALGDRIEAQDLWELDRVVERAMLALRVPPEDKDPSVLSGGERRRVALCRLLLEQNDLLLLDEPTNHLDADSVAWLEKYLTDFPGTVVAVTHDRYFLENSAGWILELDRGKGLPFEGNYSAWLEAKARRLEAEKQQASTIARQVDQELDWMRQTPSGRGTRAKARLRRYDELVQARDAAADREALTKRGAIYIPPGPRLGDVVFAAKGLSKAFGDKLLFKDLDFTIPPGAVVAILGPNGAGKSTLTKMLAGEEQPDAGEINIGDTVKISVVSQSRDDLDDAKTVFEEVADGLDIVKLGDAGAEVNGRAYTSWFGFKSAQQQQKVGILSGGERNRVQLAKAVRSGSNVLILDEPTNDLDVETIRSLEEAILDFGGVAIVVSHDRAFIDRVATHVMAFEGDSHVHFQEGNYEDYVQNRIERLGEVSLKPITYAPLI